MLTAAAADRTKTEQALESAGIHPTRHYILRADQLRDGTYRYALEDTENGQVLAEGANADNRQAIELLVGAIYQCGLSADEIRLLAQATRAYEAR